MPNAGKAGLGFRAGCLFPTVLVIVTSGAEDPAEFAVIVSAGADRADDPPNIKFV